MLQLNTVLFLVSFSLLAIVYYIALQLSLFWKIAWLDMPMHFFGGAIVALGVFTLADLKLIPRQWLTRLIILSVVIFTAVVWEFFEYYVVGLNFASDFVVDTASDLILGVIGGVIGFLVGSKIQNL